MKKSEAEKYYKREGVTKSLIGPDEQGYIFKYFKKDIEHIPYSFDKQSNIIEKKKHYIGKFIPETELIKKEDGTYYIKQKFIEGRLLKFVDINELDVNILSDLLELFDGYIAFCKNEGIELDVIGYQQDIHNLENIWKRRFLFYTRIFRSFLESTNIIISNDNKVYLIDVCDTIPLEKKTDLFHTIKGTVRQAIIDLGIKKTEYRIHRLIKQKRKELSDVLS